MVCKENPYVLYVKPIQKGYYFCFRVPLSRPELCQNKHYGGECNSCKF